MLEAHRRTLRRLRRQLMHPATTLAELGPIQAAIEELARTLENAAGGGGKGGKDHGSVTPGCRFRHP